MAVQDERALLNKEFAEALARKDADLLANFYTEDAVFLEAELNET